MEAAVDFGEEEGDSVVRFFQGLRWEHDRERGKADPTAVEAWAKEHGRRWNRRRSACNGGSFFGEIWRNADEIDDGMVGLQKRRTVQGF